MSQYPWEEIFEKYRTGKYTMKQLADKYGFNKSYGWRKAKKEGVSKGESKEKVRNEASKKVIEEEADKEAKLRLEYEKIINDIRRGAANTLFKEKDFDRLKQFKIASEIIRNCRKEQWEVNEILDIADKANIDNQGEKLDTFVRAVNNMGVKK